MLSIYKLIEKEKDNEEYGLDHETLKENKKKQKKRKQEEKAAEREGEKAGKVSKDGVIKVKDEPRKSDPEDDIGTDRKKKSKVHKKAKPSITLSNYMTDKIGIDIDI